MNLESLRLRHSRTTDATKKSALGQFLTPERTATFMAGLFPPGTGNCRLLDPGAGIGSLSAAFLERWRRGGLGFVQVDLDAFELDDTLHEQLAATLAEYRSDHLSATIHGGDFVRSAVDALSGGMFTASIPPYTHAILNPPYKKISSDSPYRLALREVGIETVNLYSAFVALAVALAASGGQIVAIIPRSFCNGPYYRPFREFLLARTAIRHIHLFASRDKAFQDDAVLQENVIIRLERGGQQGPVTITTSTDDTFADLASQEHPFDRVVLPGDPERFIHVPTSTDRAAIEEIDGVRFSLEDLGIAVSTGPVVDFRLKEHLRAMPADDTVPLLYPGHFSGGATTWPIEGFRKANAIAVNTETRKWLYPAGYYCVVRRFSSKEERRRIVASVVAPEDLRDAPFVGFENHFNVFHCGGEGLPESLAHGLALFLNTSAVDEAFRRFNGHTQVNATDLRRLKYPSIEALRELGGQAPRQPGLSQASIDARFRSVVG